MANPGKEKKAKENREEGALRRLLEEFAQLRQDVEDIKQERISRPGTTTVRPVEKGIDFDTEGTFPGTFDRVAFDRVDESAVARLAYAFSSPQKVKILRILLTEGSLSSAQIGERTGLTTGSLYHHLRELSHAAVIEQAGRNLHAITPLGRKTALMLFSLAQ